MHTKATDSLQISFLVLSGSTLSLISVTASVPDHSIEDFVKINGKQHYLWRAVDQDGEVVDVFLQAQQQNAFSKGGYISVCES